MKLKQLQTQLCELRFTGKRAWARGSATVFVFSFYIRNVDVKLSNLRVVCCTGKSERVNCHLQKQVHSVKREREVRPLWNMRGLVQLKQCVDLKLKFINSTKKTLGIWSNLISSYIELSVTTAVVTLAFSYILNIRTFVVVAVAYAFTGI